MGWKEECHCENNKPQAHFQQEDQDHRAGGSKKETELKGDCRRPLVSAYVAETSRQSSPLNRRREVDDNPERIENQEFSTPM